VSRGAKERTPKSTFNRTDVLRGLKNNRMVFTAPITREVEEGRSSFLLHGNDVEVRIAVAPEGITLLLQLMAQRRYSFEGGVLMVGIEEYGSR